MFINFKKTISNKIHENFYSHIINFNNREIKKSYKNIFTESKNKPSKYTKLLIDGSFYNLGYFYRLQIFRAALKSKNLEEHAYTWNFNKRICSNILNYLGIKHISDMTIHKNNDLLEDAENILKKIKNAKDVIDSKYPEDVPGLYLYDIILKKQRTNTVDINDKNLKFYIFEFLSSIKLSKELILRIKPDIVALSHYVSFQCAPMAYLAAKNGIDTFVLTGGFGVPRFTRIRNTKDMFFGIPHPPKEEIKCLESSKIKEFKNIGFKYLEERKSGKFLDFSGRLAFGKGKDKFKFNNVDFENKKVVTIYVGNWFDFPHVFGMNRFVDVLEWIKTTIEVASTNKKVIWLVKPHPAEKWYGGTSLENSLPKDLPENIIILPHDYDGKAIINVSDALVTFHGTAALEYASAGKPVLVADVGWYHECNFVVFPKSRKHYLELLKTDWYEEVNSKQVKANAELFAGLRFAIPTWQKDCLIPDDPYREKLKEFLPKFINLKGHIIKKEINLTREWLLSDKVDYHTFKVIKSKRNIVKGTFKKL